MTGEQASAHRSSPITPTPIRAIVRAVAQPSDVALGKRGQKIAPGQPRFQDFPYSNARRIPGRAANPESFFFLTVEIDFSQQKTSQITVNNETTARLLSLFIEWPTGCLSLHLNFNSLFFL
jgi:hypothetical protein